MSADVLKQFYAAEVARRLEQRTAGLYLSDAGACPRMRVLQALNAPRRRPSAREVEIRLLGEVIHDYLLRHRVSKVWPDAQCEVWLDTPYGRARLDAVVPSQGIVVECKKAKWQDMDRLPKQEHVVQLQSYMHFSGYKRGVLLYAVLGLGWSECAFDVPYEASMGAAIEAELEYLRTLVEKRELPPVPSGYLPDRFPCSWYDRELGVRHWCAYGRHCWREWEE